MLRVVAAIIEEDGKGASHLLICQRRRGDAFALQWEFPGGKVRPSETPRAALARELREELGIEASVGREVFRTRYRYARAAQEVEIVFLAAKCAFSVPRNLAFERFVWARRPDLARYDFLPADRVIVGKLIRGEFAYSR